MMFLNRIITLGLALLICSASVYAGGAGPNIPKATAKAENGGPEGCVEPVKDMRRNHMNFILHQRDKTMIQGIRTKKHSFKGCISCHQVKGKDDKPVTHKSEKHFCNSCHSYVSIKIDCFECHASTPQPGPAYKAKKPNDRFHKKVATKKAE